MFKSDVCVIWYRDDETGEFVVSLASDPKYKQLSIELERHNTKQKAFEARAEYMRMISDEQKDAWGKSFVYSRRTKYRRK
jgi:hypothetical protein